MKYKAVFLLAFITVFVTGEEVNDVVKRAVQSLYSGNVEKFTDDFVDNPNLRLLVFPTDGSDESRDDNFRVSSKVTDEIGTAYVQSPGTGFGIPLRKVGERWRVDTKYIVKIIDEMNANSIKGILYFSLVQNEEAIKRIISNKDNSNKFIIGKRPPGADVGVLQDVIVQSIVLRVEKNEQYVKDGKLFLNTEYVPDNGKIIYSVLYSDIEFSVVFLRGKNGWVIDDAWLLEDIVRIRKSQMP